MLQQASVTGFIRTILIIILIYYGLKVLSRLFAPLLLKYIAKKAEQKFGGQFQQRPQQQPTKKEGEVSIDKVPNVKTSNKDVGEYVDYEEID
ncbi:DUF4834 family protein [Mariniflexile sp. AS56]|uniref:DUF4834 family protein n=1 Tax=Mariniflexile sp. AS56 TaxID=3063957 RepID=UPI0026EB8496|nr:DUF4834 family protein [Mariniflexile sp. AS56]MDO7171326.1 DUF4834 family protein [Mariniflexile sp. AS56]